MDPGIKGSRTGKGYLASLYTDSLQNALTIENFAKTNEKELYLFPSFVNPTYKFCLKLIPSLSKLVDGNCFLGNEPSGSLLLLFHWYLDILFKRCTCIWLQINVHYLIWGDIVFLNTWISSVIHSMNFTYVFIDCVSVVFVLGWLSRSMFG